MKNRYACQNAEGNRYVTLDTIEECLEHLKLYEQDNLLDEGDEIYDTHLDQVLYRVIDGEIEEVDNED